MPLGTARGTRCAARRGVRFSQQVPRCGALFAALCLAIAAWQPAHGQEEADDAVAEEASVASVEEGVEDQVVEDQAPQQAREVEEVVVTGSRLKRDTFSSIAPLQIITAEVKREAGLVDAGEILQESTASSGVQIDLTFSGFVLDDGPGVVPANLRGLGSGRTLLLVNGRRMGASGVEGAPQAPDLGFLPGSMVQAYDLLLDGASSIYGSDAVGGVGNVQLRKDFDGFEISAFAGRPGHPKGDENVLALAWGRNFDRGFVGVGVEYKFNEAVPMSARPWTGQCERHVEIDEAGRIRHQDQFYTNVLGMRWDECRVGLLAGRVYVPGAGSIYYTPGRTNGGWPSFSESSAYGFGVDNDGDGETDVSFRDYSLNGRTLSEHLFSQRKTVSGMVYGEYTLEGQMNLAPYFEVLHFKRDVFIDSGAGQLWTGRLNLVPALNPYNICNPESTGVDCGTANDAMLTNPNFVPKFRARFAALCAAIGIPPQFCIPATFNQLSGPIGPAPTAPIVSVQGDRNLTWTHTAFTRAVVGMSGDLPMLDIGDMSGWSFDASITHAVSDSTASRPGIREDQLDLALGWYSQNADSPCVNDIGDAVRQARGLHELPADAMAGCVPVNLFAPSLYTPLIGDFATQAERDYVFDSRDFDTNIEMTLLSVYFTGTAFNMPAGPVAAGFGAEYRRDAIDSIPDHVARDGLFVGFFADGGAVGSRDVKELFGEIELPLVAARTGATEVDLNLSTRWTHDEYAGGSWTYSAKLGWRPIESLLVRTTWGTSFRAPNLRELFLRSQTGFLNVYDPCLIPEIAIDPIMGGYNAALDPRDAHVLENCRRHGVDPTVANDNGNVVYSVEVAAGGVLGIDAETSESLSLGFSWEQPFTNAFDLSVGMTYYKIEIDNTIIEPSAGYIVYDCYLAETGGTFCPRITRESNPQRPVMDLIDRGFINRDNETVRGVDMNFNFQKTFTIFDRPFDVSFDVTANRLIEHFDIFLNDQGEPDVNEYHREFFYPERTAIADVRITYNDWFGRWQTVYTSKVHQDPAFEDTFSDIFSTPRSDTCLGPPDDLLCRDYRTAGDHQIHRLSFGYRANTWNVLVGVRNIFDTPPPMVDSNETSLQANNASYGYSLEGRTYFLSFETSLGGGA